MSFVYKILATLLSAVFTLSAMAGIPLRTIPAEVTLGQISQEEIMYSGEKFVFSYNEGSFSLANKGVTMFTEATSEYKLGDTTVSSLSYGVYDVKEENISDARGEGVRIIATAKKDDLPTLKQIFTFYSGTDYFTVSAELSAENGEVASNYIAPIVIKDGKFQNGSPKYTNFLEVPFDNDSWATFETTNMCESGLSHEVSAFFTPDNGAGLIIGSVTHDTWKSAVEYTNKLARVDELRIYSGANTPLTRDQSPHGTVSGEKISSAIFMVGFYDSWKDGMNEFARINTTFTPKRASVNGSNPIGWNSWGSIQSDISYDFAIATSDYIKNNFQNIWKDENNVVYVNLDSFWDNMNDDRLRDFVQHCEENGQVAGIYFSPFVIWWDDPGMYNARLRKADGTVYGNDIDGCYPLDVTHPDTQWYFSWMLDRLMNLGFKYIKLDFLVHGSLEGDYYNDEIQTGIQAYNHAMKMVEEKCGDDVFINLSMAPIFPYNYANGRRLCCDSYYGIGETEYVMNSLTYGFWQSELYDWIDPDHIVLWGKDGKAKENEATSRMLSGIVTGGSFLAGDNFVNPANDADEAFARYQELLGNERLIEVLKIGRPFEAKLSAAPEYAANVFTLQNDGKTYIAAFNYTVLPKVITLDLPAKNCKVLNLLTGDSKTVKSDSLTVTLNPRDSAIYEVTSE